MNHMTVNGRRVGSRMALGLLMLGLSVPAWAALTITPITWNVVGLDSNNVNVGPNQFPVGARVCAVGAPSDGDITGSFSWTSANANINTRPGSLSSYNLGSLAAGTCTDAYFEVEVTRTAAVFDTARRYIIEATDGSSTVSTPQPREIYAERLISQNRNAVGSISFRDATALPAFPPTPADLTIVGPGTPINVAVGGIYDIRVDSSTATQGYEQLQSFIFFSNARFRIMQVHSTYTANSASYSVPTDLLYADACTWQKSPILPNYLDCLASGKTGGAISNTYRIEVISGAGTSDALNTLIYDFSGSSFHYNANFGSGGYSIVINDPQAASFSKAFSPATVPENTVSRLTLTINNPNSVLVSGYSFTDTLPAGIVVAATPGVTSSGCNAASVPTITATAGTGVVSLTNGSIAAKSTCTIGVNVIGANDGVYNNSVALFIDGEPALNGAGDPLPPATATLTITDRTPIPFGTCPSGIVENLATWQVESPLNGSGGPPTTTVSPFVSSAVAAFVARPAGQLSQGNSMPAGTVAVNNSSGSPASPSWQGTGWARAGDIGDPITSDRASRYVLTVDSSNYRNLELIFRAVAVGQGNEWAANSNIAATVFSSADGGLFSSGTDRAFTKQGFSNDLVVEAPFSGVSTTEFRITARGVGTQTAGDTAAMLLDNVIIRGCRVIPPPTIIKAFAPTAIALDNGLGPAPVDTSTLTLSIANPNTTALSGVAVSDTLPAGLVYSGAVLTNTCGGTVSLSGGPPATTLSLINGTINPSSSCTITVAVRGTTAGLKTNVSGQVTSAQTGPNTGSTGTATAQINVVAPPQIAKTFLNNPILAGSTSRLLLTITNPNPTTALSGVAFTDPLPAALTTVGSPAPVNTCGGTLTVNPASIGLTGASLLPGGSCSVAVTVTSATVGSHLNTTGNVSHQFNGTRNGNTANSTLVVNPPTPAIAVLKQVATDPAGPYGNFVVVAPGDTVYYRFTVENTGTAVLHRPASGSWVNDPNLNPVFPHNLAACDGTIAPAPNPPAPVLTLPVADAFDDDHIFICFAQTTAPGPGPDTVNNTATAVAATSAGGPVATSDTDTATYTTRVPDLQVSKTRTAPAGPVDLSMGPVAVTYRITVLNADDVVDGDTLAPIVIRDQLRAGISYVGFNGADAFWNCTLISAAPDLVECTYSAPLAAGLSTTVDLNVLVAQATPDVNNLAIALGGGDPECDDPNPFPITECKGPYTEATVPVVVSDLRAEVENGELVVRFGTITEAGTLGFRVYGNAGGKLGDRLQAGLTLAGNAVFEPQRYEIRGPYRGQTSIYLQELTNDGASISYGPYPIGVQIGAPITPQLVDWAPLQAEQAAFRQSQVQALRSAASGSQLQAEVLVDQSGVVRLTHAQLQAAGIDWTGIQASRIQLSLGNQPVALEIEGGASFGPGSALRFVGKAMEDSLYTRSNVYRLQIAANPVAPLTTVFGSPGALAPAQSAPARFVHSPERRYDVGSPTGSPWSIRRIIRSNNQPLASADEVFTLPARTSGSQPDVLTVKLWSDLNLPQSPDHSVRVRLNGSVIGSQIFDGIAAAQIRSVLPEGLLQSGSNTLTVELLGDTGLEVDRVYLQAIEVEYTAELQASEDRFLLELADTVIGSPSADRIYASTFGDVADAACARPADCSAYEVSGFSSDDIVVYRERGGRVDRLTHVDVQSDGGAFTARFASSRQPGDRYWLTLADQGLAQQVRPSLPVADPLQGVGPIDYLIVSHPSFIDHLGSLVAAREAEGYRVRVVDVEALYQVYGGGLFDPAGIQLALRRAYRELGTQMVLLVGGDTYDYMNFAGTGSISYIPTHYRATNPRFYFAPTDQPYADVNGDGRAELAIGRLPARSVAELQTMLAKTLAYPGAPHANKVLLVSDRPSGNYDYGDELAGLSPDLGQGWIVSELRLRNYASGGAVLAREDLRQAVNAGQALLTYFGHASPASWTLESLLTVNQVNSGLFANQHAPTIMWHLGCYGAYFVHPTYQTIAHGLMLQPGGAAAVIGASALTEADHDSEWRQKMGPMLGDEMIGEAMRASAAAVQQRIPAAVDISIGATLLGDPALRIRR